MTTGNAFGAERLSDILDEAVTLQPAAEQLIADCVAPGPKDAELARRGRRIAYRYFALRQWLHHLPASTPRERADRLINYHHQMVWQALNLALRPESPDTSQIAERMRGGLGRPGQQMRDLADTVKQSIDDPA